MLARSNNELSFSPALFLMSKSLRQLEDGLRVQLIALQTHVLVSGGAQATLARLVARESDNDSH